jgi:hypothetical protein
LPILDSSLSLLTVRMTLVVQFKVVGAKEVIDVSSVVPGSMTLPLVAGEVGCGHIEVSSHHPAPVLDGGLAAD